MKRLIISNLNQLKQKYSSDLLRLVRYCRDEIRGIANQYRNVGYDDDEIEEKIGNYLDEIYKDYLLTAQNEYFVTEEEFDNIYSILEDIEGPVSL